MPRRSEFGYDPSDDRPDDDGPSRTQRKQAAHEVQELADALIELPDAELARIDMEERLRDALREMQSIRKFEARRRQAKFIGKLLRQMDAEPLAAALASIRAARAQETQSLRAIELWRERLIADDAALTDFASAHRGCDLQALRHLIRAARREAALAPPGGGPPQRKGRHYRELFQHLRDTVLATDGAAAGTVPDSSSVPSSEELNR